MRRSPELRRFLEELREIESADVTGEVEAGKAALIRRKMTAIAAAMVIGIPPTSATLLLMRMRAPRRLSTIWLATG